MNMEKDAITTTYTADSNNNAHIDDAPTFSVKGSHIQLMSNKVWKSDEFIPNIGILNQQVQSKI